LKQVVPGTLKFIGEQAFTAAGQVAVAETTGGTTAVLVNLRVENEGAGDFAELIILVDDGAVTASQWSAADFLL
jgi:hypothetical protein